MEVTEELRRNIRSSIRDHLALLADLEEQRKYERNVPIANVPAELVCGWFDDSYIPDSPAHHAAFTLSERAALEDFSALFSPVADGLRNVREVADLHARREWLEVVAAAAILLRQIPEPLPNPALQRT
jgi:hypothetical protein